MAKRGQNEGSIYKRGDGRWVGVVNLGYRRGRRNRKSFYGATRRDVQEKLTKALRDQQQGLPVAPEKMSLSVFMDRWLETAIKRRVRPRTYSSYEQIARTHIVPTLGSIALTKLRPDNLQSFLNSKLEEGLSPRTVQYIHRILHMALKQAVDWDYLPRNVAGLIKPPSARSKPVEPLTPLQAAAFLVAAKGERLEALYSVAIAIGLRQGEALGLRWHDVNLEDATITVRVALQRVGGKLQLVEPKSSFSNRTIALPNFALSTLRLHRARQLQERLVAGRRWKENELVFTTAVGTPIDPRNLVRHFKRVLEKAGLPDKRFHDLRHTTASLLLAQGVHPRTAMEILGHSQISLTMNTYSHVSPELQREAADQMDAVLGLSK